MFFIVIGDKEEEKKTIAVRNRKGKTKYNVDLTEFIKATAMPIAGGCSLSVSNSKKDTMKITIPAIR